MTPKGLPDVRSPQQCENTRTQTREPLGSQPLLSLCWRDALTHPATSLSRQ